VCFAFPDKRTNNSSPDDVAYFESVKRAIVRPYEHAEHANVRANVHSYERAICSADRQSHFQSYFKPDQRSFGNVNDHTNCTALFDSY